MAMTGISARSAGIAVTVAVLCALASVDAGASEESVDRMTQAALQLDAHADRGGAQFRQYCARCHGLEAQGDPDRAIPALAGQRFKYIVRQLANFAGAERDSVTMRHVVMQKELREPQTWVDIAAWLNNAPMVRHAQTGDGTHVALGRGIFHEQYEDLGLHALISVDSRHLPLQARQRGGLERWDSYGNQRTRQP